VADTTARINERKEKATSLAENRTHDGIPTITVIVDGGWSKRSHKHSCNAKFGGGIIIHTCR